MPLARSHGEQASRDQDVAPIARRPCHVERIESLALQGFPTEGVESCMTEPFNIAVVASTSPSSEPRPAWASRGRPRSARIHSSGAATGSESMRRERRR